MLMVTTRNVVMSPLTTHPRETDMTLRPGDRVIAVRNIGGGLFDRSIQQGTQGVIVADHGFFGVSYEVAFTIPGGFLSNAETVRVSGLGDDDVRRI